MSRIPRVVLLFSLTGLAAADAAEVASEPTCLQFVEETYCEAWMGESGNVTTVEFLRDGETTDAWTRMITVRRYDGTAEIKEIAPGYFESVRTMVVLKPDVFKKLDSVHEDNAIFALTLLAPDRSHYEFVLNHFFHDGKGVVWSVFYSHKLPFAAEVDFSEVMQNRGAWTDDLTAIDAATALDSAE